MIQVINIIGTVLHFRKKGYIHFTDCKNLYYLTKQVEKSRVSWEIFQMFHLEFLIFICEEKGKQMQT